MFCHQCGTETKAEARFCHACGKPLEVVQELPAASPAPTTTTSATRPEKADTALHPWRRFFARTIDLLLAALLLVALYVILLLWFPNKAAQIVGALTNPITAAVIIYWLWVPVEAALLANFGTTPAKWIFGIRVLKFDGRKLTFAEALKRAAFACILGDGLGIPGAALFTRAYAYDRLKKTETTAWDMACGSVVQHSKWGAGRVIGATVVVLIALVSSSILLTIGKTQETANAAKAKPPQSSKSAPVENRQVSVSEQEGVKRAYYECLSTWQNNHPAAWQKHVKEYTDYDGNLSDYFWIGRPDVKHCSIDLGIPITESIPSGLSGTDEYRLCIRNWQEKNQATWQRFLKKEAENGSDWHPVMVRIAPLRPDLKACEREIPRFDAPEQRKPKVTFPPGHPLNVPLLR